MFFLAVLFELTVLLEIPNVPLLIVMFPVTPLFITLKPPGLPETSLCNERQIVYSTLAPAPNPEELHLLPQ